MDSTVFDDAVATMDTVSQLTAAIRKVARVVDGAAQVIAAVCTLDYTKPGKPDIDWDDPQAKQNLVSDLVNDALRLLDALAGRAPRSATPPRRTLWACWRWWQGRTWSPRRTPTGPMGGGASPGR